MKSIRYLSLIMMSAMFAACSAKISGGGSDDPITKQNDSWGTYSDGPLTGKVFGQDWKAVTAIVRPFGTSGDTVSVEFYSETAAQVCKGFTPRKPYATLAIPAQYQAAEYKLDMSTGEGGGNPLIFTSGSQNLMAEKTRVRITAQNATGFEASVYASGTDESGVSEINGKIQVSDCSKMVDFAVWNEIEGWYNLQTFDGKAVKPRTAIANFDQQKFYDRAGSRYVKTLALPLFSWIGENSDSSYYFGPMEGLGTTTVTEKDGRKTWTYSYHGPINFRAQDIVLNLEITVVKVQSSYTVSYTIEIPNEVKTESHTFVMTR